MTIAVMGKGRKPMAEYIFEISDVLYDEETGEAVMKPCIKGKLIRCKECLFWNEIPSNTVTPEYHKCKLLGIQMTAHDYCSRGRRENDGSD